ncbi:extracellular superoxide dismutase [Cu-Zn] [Clonorchis sinensis]|uniref:Extracellular superoxide dismutase [Cu-Zn] n=1 Tax=Clonorchis sinensis TaxID=79923 RepID=H2KTR7_CLOSI|nr:extracellular superoxide dismutase [Cu-Zn] [Clonorchis sinensis]
MLGLLRNKPQCLATVLFLLVYSCADACISFNIAPDPTWLIPGIATFETPYGGQVRFKPLATGSIQINGSVTGLPPNKTLGVHVHENGDLNNGCQNVGSHWSLSEQTHGDMKAKYRHAGDLGNLKTDNEGVMQFDLVYWPFEDDPSRGFIGLALVIKNGEDDLGLGHNERSSTTGNSGEPLTCAVIGRARAQVEEFE